MLIKFISHPLWEQMHILNPKLRLQEYKNWDLFLSTKLIGNYDQKVQLPMHGRYFLGLTSLIAKILNYQQVLGVDITKPFLCIRKSLKSLFHLENKLGNTINEGLAQNIVAVFLVWMMIVCFSLSAGVELSYLDYFIIASWQLSGLVLFVITLLYLKKRLFDEYFRLYTSLQVLAALHEYGANYSQLVNESQLFNFGLQNEFLKNILNILQGALHKHQKFGVDMIEEFHGVEQELNHFYEIQFEKFMKLSLVCKFGFLVIFQVVCYFFMLYKIGTTFIFQNLNLHH